MSTPLIVIIKNHKKPFKRRTTSTSQIKIEPPAKIRNWQKKKSNYQRQLQNQTLALPDSNWLSRILWQKMARVMRHLLLFWKPVAFRAFPMQTRNPAPFSSRPRKQASVTSQLFYRNIKFWRAKKN